MTIKLRKRKTAVLKRKLESHLESNTIPKKKPTQSSVNPTVTAEGKGQTCNKPNVGVSIKSNSTVTTGTEEPIVFALNLTIYSYRRVFCKVGTNSKTSYNVKRPDNNYRASFHISSALSQSESSLVARWATSWRITILPTAVVVCFSGNCTCPRTCVCS